MDGIRSVGGVTPRQPVAPQQDLQTAQVQRQERLERAEARGIEQQEGRQETARLSQQAPSGRVERTPEGQYGSSGRETSQADSTGGFFNQQA